MLLQAFWNGGALLFLEVWIRFQTGMFIPSETKPRSKTLLLLVTDTHNNLPCQVQGIYHPFLKRKLLQKLFEAWVLNVLQWNAENEQAVDLQVLQILTYESMFS